MFYEGQKSYLEMFLENTSTPKKRYKYFLEAQENAIVKYNDPQTSEREKNELFETIITRAFKDIIDGVLEMPNFHSITAKGINLVELKEATFFRLIEKIHKFTPGIIGKRSGKVVKAFSYFSTIAKNYILEVITRHEKVKIHKADVESSIDLSILSEETLEKISGNNTENIILDDYVTVFNSTKHGIVEIIKDIIMEEEEKTKRDEDFIKLGYCLKYLLEKWDKIEFMKKNEFMRILTLYTSFPQQKVSVLFKRFKTGVLKKIKPSALHKNKRKKVEIELEEDLYLFNTEEPEVEIDFEDIDEVISMPEEQEEDEETKIMKYEVYSIEDFEARELKANNAKIKKEWRIKRTLP